MSSHESPPRAPRVLVWREVWLPASETFIRNQLGALSRWSGVPVGLYRSETALSRSTDDVLSERPMPAGRVRSRLATRRMVNRKLPEAIQKYSPDLIHVHFLKNAIPLTGIAHRYNIPLVVTVHGFDVTSWPDAGNSQRWARPILAPLRRHAVRKTLSRIDTVIAVSEAIRERVIERGARPEQVQVLPIGIPTGDASDLSDLAGRSGVVFVGRLVEVKGVQDLLTAWALLPPEFQTSLTIVGDGPERAALEQLAVDLQIDVTFAGVVSPAEVRERMSKAAIFCGPSRTAPSGDAEGFGMVFLEAAAQGLAVVSYRHGGIPEAVLDGETGLLAPEGDIPGLTRRLQTLLADDALRIRLARAGHARVMAEFDITVCTRRLEKLYDAVVEGGSFH